MRAMRQRRLLLLLTSLLLMSAATRTASANPVSQDETDGPNNRKLLGSSVVTSVSVIMDHPNGTKTYITDGEPPEVPSVVGSPAALMSPDRYEFYSFGKDGELVKKLMTLDQIQGLIAGGDELNAHIEGGQPVHFYQQPLVQAGEPEGVNKVLESVQNVLKSEMQTAHIPDHLDMPPVGDDSWSILLPGFLNSELDYKESLKTTSKPADVPKRPVDVRPPFPPTTSSTTVPAPVEAVKVTTPRHPVTTSPPKAPSRPSSQTTIRRPPQSPATTVKYSAHYTTTPPNLKLQNKPATVVKKPTGTMPKPPQPPSKTPATNRPTSARPSNVTSSQRPKIPVTVAPPKRVQNATEPNTTLRPTTAKGTTEKMRPSGIPTITHYLPIQTSVGPSEAVKTTKPAVPTKSTAKPTPKPVSKPPKPYVKNQPTTTTVKATERPTTTVQATERLTTTVKATVRPTTTVQATEKPTTVKATERPIPTTNVPVAEKLVQKTASVLDAASSDMISVSVSTPSGPPSTLKVTAPTTARPMSTPMRPMSTPMRPMSTPSGSISTPMRPLTTNKAPVVSIQPNRTKTTPRPVATTQKNGKNPPRPTPSVSSSSLATHKPVVVLSNKPFDRPFVKVVPNATYAALMAARPMTSTTKITTMTTQSRQPTTAAPEVTTVVTQPPTTAATATTNQDFSTTLSNELAQAPMKLAASLKEPEQNVFEKVPLMSTTLRDVPTIVSTIMTTEGTTKWEQIPNAMTQNGAVTTQNGAAMTQNGAMTTQNGTMTDQNGAMTTSGNFTTVTTPGNVGTTTGNVGTTPSIVRTTSAPVDLRTVTTNGEPSTVTMAASTMVTTDSPPTTFNKVYIINNSEPQTIKMPLSKTSTEKRTQEETASTIADWIGSRTDVTSTTENSQTTSTTTDAPSTITESPSSTTFKDQVMEEGISAVANILLDDNKSVVEKSALAEQLAISESSSTTELAATTRAETTVNDGPAFREEPDERDRASTRRDDNSWRTTTVLTTVADTTTSPPITTTTVAPEMKKSAVEKKKVAVKRDEVAQPVKSKPIKESKLNPDSEEQPQESQSQAQAVSTEGTTMMMEQVKLTEKGPSTPPSPPPPPPAPSVKIPLQEVKAPPPAGKRPSYSNEVTPPPAIDLHPAPYESMGAEASTAFLAEDVRRFADLCNELAFRLWTALTAKGEKGQISSRSLVMSPFAAVSLLAMVFLGARGATSGQMNEILRLDDMVTFNPHQVLQNVTDSVISSRNVGVATAAFVRQLYSDKSKGKILDFYKERAQQYYGGHVEEVSFSTVGDVVRRRTNLLVKRQTLGKVPEYLRGSSLNLRPPLAAFSANIFQTDCDSGSTDGRDGEMYFVVRPSTRQRRLVPVPAVVWRTGFSAGYEPSLDATSVCLNQDSVVSTLLILPGQQGQVAPGDGLARLEQRLIETSYRRGGWSRLLRSLLPRPGLELQVPRFSHRSVLNVTSALGRMGLKDLFSFKADLRGLNGGATELHLSDMVQVNTFSTCGEEVLGARHHIETYPSSPTRSGREDALPNYLDDEPHYEPRRPRYHFNGDDVVDGRPRTGRLPLPAPSTDPAPPRLRFDRPFLYIVRHNPSGIILHIGRFNPRLLP